MYEVVVVISRVAPSRTLWKHGSKNSCLSKVGEQQQQQQQSAIKQKLSRQKKQFGATYNTSYRLAEPTTAFDQWYIYICIAITTDTPYCAIHTPIIFTIAHNLPLCTPCIHENTLFYVSGASWQSSAE